MANLICAEENKRGTCQFKIEANSGDSYIIGFSSNEPLFNKESYSKMLCSIIDDFQNSGQSDMFNYIEMQMARAKMEMPLFLMPDRNEERTRIGNKIRSIRERKSMDAKTLSRLTDIDPSNLSRIETGKFSAGLDILCRIALALDARMDIIPNAESIKGELNMRRNIWAISTGDFCPFETIPPYGCFYWPSIHDQDVKIGDLVAVYNNSRHDYYGGFIVAETDVHPGNIMEQIPGSPSPCPLEGYNKYMKININHSLSSTQQTIIENAALKQIKGEPDRWVLLKGDIL